MTQSYEKISAIIILAAAAVVAGNAWLIEHNPSWDWINALMGICGGFIIAVLHVRPQPGNHDQIIKYITLICMAGMIFNLAMKSIGLEIDWLWYPIDAGVVIAFAWFGYRQLRAG